MPQTCFVPKSAIAVATSTLDGSCPKTSVPLFVQTNIECSESAHSLEYYTHIQHNNLLTYERKKYSLKLAF